jgi:hypothetical protein
MIMHLRIVSTPLSDGSLVFDVVVIKHGATFRFSCMSHGDAEEFMRGLAALIELHTTDTIESGQP